MTARFGIGLTGGTVGLDGGVYCCVRPDDLEAPNGFGVVVARTPRRVEAGFHADNYAGAMLRQMSDADESVRAAFALLANNAVARGVRLYVAVDGVPISDFAQLPVTHWHRFELEADVRVPTAKIAEDAADELVLGVASECLGLALVLLPVEEVGEGGTEGLPEGGRMRVEVNRYERSPANRAACIARFGSRCLICEFDFRSFYGELGEGYIEVHHHTLVSAMGGSYRIDPFRDLSPVCGNCHAMLHRENPPITVAALREQLRLRGRLP